MIKVGDKFQTNSSGECTVISYTNKNNIVVQFMDGNTVQVRSSSLRSGGVLNPFDRTCYGVGFSGAQLNTHGESTENKKYRKCWSSMLQRCYDEKYQAKQPTYIGVVVCDEWHNFQNFKKWCAKNYIEGFELDKDLRKFGSKIYSPETCSFVPKQINGFFNIYTDNKELPIGVRKVSKSTYRVVCSDVTGKQIWLGAYNSEQEAFDVYVNFKVQVAKDLANIYRSKLHPEVTKTLETFEFKKTY